MSVFCAIICLTCLFIVFTEYNKKEKRNKLYIGLIVTLIIMLLSDAAANGLQGKPGINPYLMIRILSIAYICGPVMMIFLTRLIMTIINEKTFASKTAFFASYIAIGTCVLDIIFILISQFIPLYFEVDNNNLLIRNQIWNIVTQSLAFICMFIGSGILISYKKSISRREFITMLAQIVIPAFSVVFYIFFVELSVVNYAVTIAVLLYFGNVQSELIYKIKQKELELIKGHISIMLSQIQPHFLFNSLTAIIGLCDKDPARAKEMTFEFSEYLRSNMESLTEKELISFEQELKHIEVYLSLEKAIYGKGLNVVYNIEVSDFKLPVLTLQPIVENAVKHGIGKREGGGTVSVSAIQTDKAYVLNVSDDGLGFVVKENERTSVGIANVTNRLSVMCGGSLEIKSEPQVGSTVTITIPK